MTMDFAHTPVMVDEVLDVLRPVPAGLVVDATVGGGGHAAVLLADRPDIELLGLDRDGSAIEAASERLAGFGDRVTLRRARFDGLAGTLDDLGHEDIVGVLFDLGVSSAQLDHPDRGFAYRHDGPIDMRMDDRQSMTAAELVNESDEATLAAILRRYADERFAARIAKAIVAARPVETTAELADIVRDAIPAAARRTGGHPAKRTFQALRVAVNDELDVLEPALDQAIERLVPTGRGAVLTYHSGEDRIVAQTLRRYSRPEPTPRGLPVDPVQPPITLLGKRAQRPTADEVARNPRAESARLRSFIKNEGGVKNEGGEKNEGRADR